VTAFREGESEEYNSEVDGDMSMEDNGVNYDILGVRDASSSAHKPLLNLVMRFEELPDDFEECLTFEQRRKTK